jgi:hypothetical protein
MALRSTLPLTEMSVRKYMPPGDNPFAVNNNNNNNNYYYYYYLLLGKEGCMVQ